MLGGEVGRWGIRINSKKNIKGLSKTPVTNSNTEGSANPQSWLQHQTHNKITNSNTTCRKQNEDSTPFTDQSNSFGNSSISCSEYWSRRLGIICTCWIWSETFSMISSGTTCEKKTSTTVNTLPVKYPTFKGKLIHKFKKIKKHLKTKLKQSSLSVGTGSQNLNTYIYVYANQ